MSTVDAGRFRISMKVTGIAVAISLIGIMTSLTVACVIGSAEEDYSAMMETLERFPAS